MPEDKNVVPQPEQPEESKKQDEVPPSAEQKDWSSKEYKNQAEKVDHFIQGDNPSVTIQYYNTPAPNLEQIEQVIRKVYGEKESPNSDGSSSNVSNRKSALEDKFKDNLVYKAQDAALMNDAGAQTTSGAVQLPEDDELSKWYYELSDYNQCFVQAVAVLHGAPVHEVVQAAEELYKPIKEAAKLKDNGRVSSTDRLACTYTSDRRVNNVVRLFWQDTDSQGSSPFGLRVLRFIAKESQMSFGGQSGQIFLKLLQQWATVLKGECGWRATRALGVIWWSLDKNKLFGIATEWGNSEIPRDWQRAAYFLEGAYEADRLVNGPVADDPKESAVLWVLKQWISYARNSVNIRIGSSTAETYELIGRSSPELALRGLESLRELPPNDVNNGTDSLPLDIYVASVFSSVNLTLSGHVRTVLTYLAQRVESLSYQRSQSPRMKLHERQRQRFQRQLSLEAAFDTFFLTAISSLAAVKEQGSVEYSLTQPLPQKPPLPDTNGKDVLLAGILLKDESIWRTNICTLLCASIIEKNDDQAFNLMRQWAVIVLNDQSAHPEQLRKAYVEFLVEVGQKVNAWYYHLKELEFQVGPATVTFRRKLERWQLEARRRHTALGTLAQEVLEQLPF